MNSSFMGPFDGDGKGDGEGTGGTYGGSGGNPFCEEDAIHDDNDDDDSKNGNEFYSLYPYEVLYGSISVSVYNMFFCVYDVISIVT